MIFSEAWLKEWVDPQMSSDHLMERLTMAGLEVDGFSSVASNFKGIVVGKVITVEPHPNADKLKLCLVNDGVEDYKVVCGAPNVIPGMKVPFAKVGAEIQARNEEAPLKIKKAKIRGEESSGMLCSAEELGLEDKSDGLLAFPDEFSLGSDVRHALELEDLSIELDLTPNRGDCLGMRGLAREVAVLTRSECKEPDFYPAQIKHKTELPIDILAQDQCPRYLGRVVKNIDPNQTSPLWLREKLRRSGLRSIDPVVDVTNYVLMELGQPMHAFDYDKLLGGIRVRMAEKNEKLTLLDGKEVSLQPDILVISDHEKAVAMAGIMGGLATSVSEKTKNVFLECAFFSPLAIAGKARTYGLHTDASHRYERGVDYELQHLAMERATEILISIVGGEAGPITETLGNLPKNSSVDLLFANVKSLLGIEIPPVEIKDILTRLGFVIDKEDQEGLTVGVPTYRFDISLEADLVEELVRVYGYDNVPKTSGFFSQKLSTKEPEKMVPHDRIRNSLVDLGYQEVVTYSFIDPKQSDLILVLPDAQTISLQNPISTEMSVMRSSLLPGLVDAYTHNVNRHQERVRVFESGLVFLKEEKEIKQEHRVAGLISGDRLPRNWVNEKGLSDFYDIKGDVETLIALGNSVEEFSFDNSEHPSMHPGQCAKVTTPTGVEVGFVGALHPRICQSLGLDGSIFVFELSLDVLQNGVLPRAQALSKFPEVSRDLAITVSSEIPAAKILANVRQNAGDYLSNSRIFDVYQGDGIEKGKKSIALGLTWQHPSRTLSDDEINKIISSCVKGLHEQFNANLRD